MSIYLQVQTQTQVVINCLMLLHPSAQQDMLTQVLGSQVMPGFLDDVMSYNSLTTISRLAWTQSFSYWHEFDASTCHPPTLRPVWMSVLQNTRININTSFYRNGSFFGKQKASIAEMSVPSTCCASVIAAFDWLCDVAGGRSYLISQLSLPRSVLRMM